MPRITDFADDFNRANNADVGANWDSGYTSYASNQLVNNCIRPGAVDSDTLESVNAVSLPDDQWAQFTIKTLTAVAAIAGASIYLRCNAPGGTETAYIFGVAVGVTFTSRIASSIAGVQADLITENATTWAAGDILGAEVQGTTLRLYRNSALLLTFTDSSIASGARAAVNMYNQTNAANTEVDDFSEGHFDNDTVPAFLQQPGASFTGQMWM